MKNSIILIIAMIVLISCQDNNTPNQANQDPQASEVKVKQDPVPHTISQQEVARIALLQAKQLITNAKSKNIDLTSVNETYDKAQALYDNGEFKKAQVTAVDARHQVEDVTAMQATSNR
jgi:PBP1b-binding outer membrane lipoprotein LpoB